MKRIDFEAFNKGLYLRMSHTEKWEKGSHEAFLSFLSDDEAVSPDLKNDMPQFIFNVEETQGDEYQVPQIRSGHL